MALEIVWRNPKPLIRTKQTVLRIQTDRLCALYVVTNSACEQEFRLMSSAVITAA